jgi:glycosyltransferase involved in cell wall biosynthesis
VSRPLVSVLLPVRDGAATLPAALDSLLAQTLADFEILCVDDGSRDGTPRVLADYAARDPRVRPVSQEPLGIVAALNHGLAQARGSYVARMDADDLCLPERLREQAAFLEANPRIGLVACRVGFGGDRNAAGGYARYVDWTNSLLTPEDISLNRFRESPLAHPSVMFRASLVAGHGGYRHGDFPEDYELWLRWLEAGVAMAKLDRELLVWNDSSGRLSRTDPRYSPQAFYALKAGHLARWLARHNARHPEVWVLGAGRTTRKRAELLQEHGVVIRAWLDIDPRKIGHRVHGVPVLHREDIPEPGGCFALSYVASHGADKDIRAFLEGRGFVLGRDFLPAA